MESRLASSVLRIWQETLLNHRWLAFVLPMFLYMLIGSFEPTDPDSGNYKFYPWIYGFKLFATVAALRLAWPLYKPMVRPIGLQGVSIGVLGAAIWIGVCHLELERTYLVPLLQQFGLDRYFGAQTRSAFNPFIQLAGSTVGITLYLVVRGTGLALVVPIMEEYFLRGFLMRYMATEKWWKYPIGMVTKSSAVAGTIVPMLMHPGELIAAALWFSLITVLYIRTKNLWECIAAHGTTNLLIGIHVVIFGAWRLV